MTDFLHGLLLTQIEQTTAALLLARQSLTLHKAVVRQIAQGVIPPCVDDLDREVGSIDRALAAVEYRTGAVREQLGLPTVAVH